MTMHKLDEVLLHYGVKGMKWDDTKAKNEEDKNKKPITKQKVNELKSFVTKLKAKVTPTTTSKKTTTTTAYIKGNATQPKPKTTVVKSGPAVMGPPKPKSKKTSITVHETKIKSPSDKSIKTAAKIQADKFKKQNTTVNKIKTAIESAKKKSKTKDGSAIAPKPKVKDGKIMVSKKIRDNMDRDRRNEDRTKHEQARELAKKPDSKYINIIVKGKTKRVTKKEADAMIREKIRSQRK